MHLILLGPPSAGKGTQASMLAQKFGLLHLATGDLLRESVAAGTSLGRKAKKFMDSGALVPDAIVLGLLERKMKSTSQPKGFILDGFPRSIEQAKTLDEITDIDLVLCIDVDYAKLVERATGRRICKNCGAVYHLKFNPPRNPGRCDRDGGELYLRNDDNEAVIRKRLTTYEQQTRPVIQYYESRKKLRYIDGDGRIEDVRKRLLDAIVDYWPDLKSAAEAPVYPPKAYAQESREAPIAQPSSKPDYAKAQGSRKKRGKGRRGKGGRNQFKKFRPRKPRRDEQR